MNIVFWVLQALAALAFLGAGSMKLFRPVEKLREMMTWARHTTPPVIRLVGLVELLGALGLILPAATHILPWLTPAAAIGLAITMLGALIVHIRLRETTPQQLGAPIVLFLLCLLIVIGRLVIAPF